MSPSEDILNEILTLKNSIETSLPNCKVTISNIINRTDNGKAMLTIKNMKQPFKIDRIGYH